MIRIAKFASAAFAAGLLSITLVACGGGQESSSSAAESSAQSQAASASAQAASGEVASGASAQAQSASAQAASATASKEELLAELKSILSKDDYKSVTMKIKGTSSLDLGSLEDPSEAEAQADADGEGSALDIPTDITVKADLSGKTARMYVSTNLLGQDIEAYITGNDVVVVADGEAASATLEDLGLGEYGSVDAILKTQGGDIDEFEDAINNIVRTTDGDETIYTVSCDPDKFVEENGDLAALEQTRDNMKLSDVTVVYRVDGNKQLRGMEVSMSSSAFSSDVTLTMSDYDSTTVPKAPEASTTLAESSVGLVDTVYEDIDEGLYEEGDEYYDDEDIEYVEDEGEYYIDEDGNEYYVDEDGNEYEVVYEDEGDYEEEYYDEGEYEEEE